MHAVCIHTNYADTNLVADWSHQRRMAMPDQTLEGFKLTVCPDDTSDVGHHEMSPAALAQDVDHILEDAEPASARTQLLNIIKDHQISSSCA